ncbi:MAG: polyphosphate kinase 1 [Planctomycetes bacterium]|nr:polyphosphate kinase 1 [Planctomycetota bacterium]
MKDRHSPRDADGPEPRAACALRDASLYLNREISLLRFHQRVLELAKNTRVPLLERLRFLGISSTNLDEFFEVRVAGLRQQLVFHLDEAGSDGASPLESLRAIREETSHLVAEQYRTLLDDILPDLEREGVRISFRTTWTPGIARWARGYFRDQVAPVLTPVALDPAHPFPTVLNKSLAFIASLDGKDAFGRTTRLAVVQAPRLLPRLIRLPEGVAEVPHHFVTLSGVIHHSLSSIFPSMRVSACDPFRVTRNSELWIGGEESEDLLRTVKGELHHRHFGAAVRLEVGRHATPGIRSFLLRQFGLQEQDLYVVPGPVNLHRIAALCDLVDRPDLKYPAFRPSSRAAEEMGVDPFRRIRRGDILLHHPFDSFAPIVDLLLAAAFDADVLAIRATLYRIGEASPLVDALFDAARNGKEVTVVIELRARFDEAANIDVATRLQQAGVKVVYGIVGYKAHAKGLLIVRREQGRMRRYVHLGTGNYHARNSRSYTDLGLLTADDEIGRDVHELFQQVTGLGSAPRMRKLLQAPFELHREILACIAKEADEALHGRPSHIRAKMNALIEPELIRALYRASQAGVVVDLVVRGICCLRPGIPGISERITVRSVVGRFLEHSRIFHFRAGGRDLVYSSSADWMPRNFFRRIEIAFPLLTEAIRRRALAECLDPYFRDNQDAWLLGSDGLYRRADPGESPPFSAQEHLMALHAPGRAGPSA